MAAERRTVADLLVRCLEHEGVTCVFGIPGEENIHFTDALSTFVDPLRPGPPRAGRVVHGRDLRPHHRARRSLLGDPRSGSDQSAARDRRRHHQQHPGRCAVGTGRTEPHLQGVPSERRPGVDVLAGDQVGRTWSLTPGAVPEMVRKAFKLAQTERPGAVYLAVPEDVESTAVRRGV